MAEEYCGICKFHDAHQGMCRRYAPRMLYPDHKFLAFHNSELLRSIAWSLHTLGEIEKPGEHDNLCTDSMEVTKQAWPDVDEEDWCGEFVRDHRKPAPGG